MRLFFVLTFLRSTDKYRYKHLYLSVLQTLVYQLIRLHLCSRKTTK